MPINITGLKMKLEKILSFCFIFFVCVYSCKQDHSTSDSHHVKVTSHVSDTIYLSQLVDVVSQFSIRHDKPLPPVRSIFPLDSGYIAWIANNVYKLDSKGMILNSMINNQNDFTFGKISAVDVVDGQIYILERNSKSYKTFDKNFTLLKDVKIPFYALSFGVKSEHEIYFYQGFEKTPEFDHQVYLFDLDKQLVIQKYFPTSDNQSKYYNYKTNNNVLRQDTNFYFWNGSDRVIYTFNKSTNDTFFSFDFGANNLPFDYIDKGKFGDVVEFQSAIEKTDYVYRFYNFNKTDRYILTTIAKGKNRFFVFKNLDSGKEFVGETIKDDVLGTGIISSLDEDDSFLNVINNSQLVIYRENIDYSLQNQEVGNVIFSKFKF
jgi:hypothetical protein